jgi:putative transposase
MTSKPVALLLADLGVTKTHARPHVSNDNPFSEAQFKTLKYRPAFPERFGSIQDARAHCHVFFPWYNIEHHHSGLGLLTPHDVHSGLAEQRVAARATVLTVAHAAHPERFPAGPPHPPARPMEVWINSPATRTTGERLLHSASGAAFLASGSVCYLSSDSHSANGTDRRAHERSGHADVIGANR